ncbi:MAG: hypothetical protein ACYTG7_02675 [Planctomycetota bacterium]
MRKRSRLSRILTVLCLASLALGCLTSSSDPDSPSRFARDRSDPPDWYMNPPISDRYIYAVGWSGPTYKPSKAREQALKRAISTLASYARSHIKNETVISQDMNKTKAISLTDVNVEGFISGFTIVAERPIFDTGKNRSPPGTIYILIRIPKEKLELR